MTTTEILTGYVEYEVVGAVYLTGWVYGAARVDAVVRRCHADEFDASVRFAESNSLTAEQSAHSKTVQQLVWQWQQDFYFIIRIHYTYRQKHVVILLTN